jgi:predicted nucleic acid-binding protein
LKRSSPNLPTRLSLDSSVIIARFLGEETGSNAKSVLSDDIHKLYIPHTAVAEAYYVLCRKRGSETADRVITTFLDGRRAEIVASEELDLAAGRYKCERAISLADCLVLATAKLYQASALFARSEADLTREMKSQAFDVDILFLSDIANSRANR